MEKTTLKRHREHIQSFTVTKKVVATFSNAKEWSTHTAYGLTDIALGASSKVYPLRRTVKECIRQWRREG